MRPNIPSRGLPGRSKKRECPSLTRKSDGGKYGRRSDPLAPEVSVVMSVYNGAGYLGDALDSILQQTLADFEFIIVNDGSTDGSGNILQRAASVDDRVSVLSNATNIGLSRSLNRGIAVARGKFIARQDADDISVRDRLRTQLDVFERFPKVGIVGSAVRVIDEHGRPGKVLHVPEENTQICWRMLFRNEFKHSTVMLRREILERNSLIYNQEYRYAQDYELWSRVLLFCQGYNVRRPLVYFRKHASQITETRTDQQEGYAGRVREQNIRRLCPALESVQCKKMHDLMYDHPVDVSLEDMELYCKFFTLLDHFSKSRKDIDFQRIAAIRSGLGRHIISAIPAKKIYDFVVSGLAVCIMRNSYEAFLTESAKRILKAVHEIQRV